MGETLKSSFQMQRNKRFVFLDMLFIHLSHFALP